MARKFFYVCVGMFLLALSYHFGAREATAQSPSPEVAVLTGTLAAVNIPVIPLPTYRDGTTALESECRWIISPVFINRRALDGMPDFQFETIGRQMSVMSPSVSESPSRVDYMVIAVRGSAQPTPTQQQSWGQLKSRYR